MNRFLGFDWQSFGRRKTSPLATHVLMVPPAVLVGVIPGGPCACGVCLVPPAVPVACLSWCSLSRLLSCTLLVLFARRLHQTTANKIDSTCANNTAHAGKHSSTSNFMMLNLHTSWDATKLEIVEITTSRNPFTLIIQTKPKKTLELCRDKIARAVELFLATQKMLATATSQAGHLMDNAWVGARITTSMVPVILRFGCDLLF